MNPGDDNKNIPVNLEELRKIMVDEIEETSLLEFIDRHLVLDPDSPFGRPELSESPEKPPWKITVTT